MNFSIITYFWGNPKNIERFAESAKKYTDDIVVAYVDLFDYELPKIENVSYLKLDHSFLIDNGHGNLLQLATDAAKYDYVYFLHVGAEIVSFDKKFFEEEGQNYSVIRCQENGYEYTHAEGNSTPITMSKDGKFYSTKFIFHDKNYAKWNGNVHEGVRADVNENGDLVKAVSWYPIVTWQRFNNVNSGASYNWEDQYYFENEKDPSKNRQRLACRDHGRNYRGDMRARPRGVALPRADVRTLGSLPPDHAAPRGEAGAGGAARAQKVQHSA
jgi:hypothetical protein